MSVPIYNSDIIHIRQDWRTKVWIIPDADQRLLLRIVADLNWAIRQEMGPQHEGPLRFVIPLAMRFVEQAGPHSFRHPKGSNPYNVMGKGVLREDNQEEDARGNMYDKPAEFQAYNGERQGSVRQGGVNTESELQLGGGCYAAGNVAKPPVSVTVSTMVCWGR